MPVKLAEFLGRHGLDRCLRLFIRDGILTFQELEGSSDERLNSLNLPPRELLALRKALGRKIEETELPPPSVPEIQQRSEPRKPPTRNEDNPARLPSRIRGLKIFALVISALLAVALVVLAVVYIHRNLLYESERPLFHSEEKDKSDRPTTEAAKRQNPGPLEGEAPSFSGFISRYQKAIQGQNPSEIVSFFTPDGRIEYYQKSIARQELLTLLEGERLNEPILIRSTEYLGLLVPPPINDPAITWIRLALRYETKKGKFEKKIRIGVIRSPAGGYAIFSESNDGLPVELDTISPPSPWGGNRGAPYSPVAWTDPGYLSPGQIHQLELVFYGCKPSEPWRLPQIPQMQVLGQPAMSHTFRQGRTDLNVLFSIRLFDSGEVKIPAFGVMTDRGLVEVPSLVLNPPSSPRESDSTAERSMGRGLPAQRRPKNPQEEVTQVKDFYSPADVFPDGKTGLRLVGKFIVLQFSNGGNYLSADESRGEKDAMRRFVPKNCNLPLGARYTFTREQPLVISSESLLGQYGVLVPNGIRPDHY